MQRTVKTLKKSQYKLLKITSTKLIFVIIVLDNVLVFLSVRDVGGRVSNVATWRVQESSRLAVPQIPHASMSRKFSIVVVAIHLVSVPVVGSVAIRVFVTVGIGIPVAMGVIAVADVLDHDGVCLWAAVVDLVNLVAVGWPFPHQPLPGFAAPTTTLQNLV